MARTVDLVGDAWAALILRDAFYGVRRFDAFQANLRIGRNVLTQRLARFVDEGVMDKVSYQERPLRYEYRLTDKGRALFDVVLALMRWGDTWMAPEGPPVVLRSRETGAVVEAVMVDTATGAPIDPRQVYAEPGPGFPDVHRARARREGRFADPDVDSRR